METEKKATEKKVSCNQRINKFIACFYTPKNILVLITASLLILFDKPITKFISANLVELIFSKIEVNNINTGLFISFFVLILIYLFHKIYIRYRLSFPQYFFFSLLIYFYARYRCFENLFQLKSSFFPIKYSDFILLLVIYPFSLLNYLREKKDNKPFFIEDNPIHVEIKDQEFRTKLAKKLRKKLSGQVFKKSFSVGILGSWGVGKTSFMNLLKEEFKTDQQAIVISYNPFYNSDEKAIIKDFFQAIIKEIRRYNADLTTKFEEYVKYLVNQPDTKWLKSFQALYTLIDNDKVETAEDQYEKIDKALQKLNRQLIIMIDDLDRMTKNEIIEILKIIRNTANFHNTVYLITMDKQYVVDSLKDEYKGKDFLQKFFQYELVLPQVDNQSLIDRFVSFVEASKIVETGTLIKCIDKTLFETNIRTLREVLLLANSFVFEYSLVKKEVDISEFLLLQIFKLKYPLAYKEFSENLKDYLRNQDDFYYFLKGADKEGKDFLKIEVEKFNIDERDLNNIEEILKQLFHTDKENNPLSIVKKENWEKYFGLKSSKKDNSETKN